MLLYKSLLAAMLLLTTTVLAELPLGEKPPEVKLADKGGGRLDGTEWCSTEIRGKVHVLMYVDPDEKDLNEHVAAALRKENFPEETFGSIAVINLAATWKPNWLIAKILKGKQEKYPRTIYVKDAKSALVDTWGLADDSYSVVAFDRDGKVIFRKDGLLSATETEALMQIIREQLK